MTGWWCIGTLGRHGRFCGRWEIYCDGRLGQSGVIPVLQGGDTGSSSVWFGVLGTVRRDNVVDVGHPRGNFKSDHWEAGTASGQWDLRDTSSGGGPTGDREKVVG